MKSGPGLAEKINSQPFQANTLHYIASCTKSFTSALIGIAIDKGYLEGVDQKVLDFFPARIIANNTSGKQAMKLENLLTMTSGLDWSEWRSYDFQNTEIEMTRSSDWVQFVLDRPMRSDPGNDWTYSTGNSHLLSAILQKSTGMNTMAFAESYLFKPLGITNFLWQADPEGIYGGGVGLELTPRDMAKFGYLYLHDGLWDGMQVVPREWVRTSTADHIQTDVEHRDYGYQWWIHSNGVFVANGYGGQRIFVAPEQGVVAVFTAGLAYPEMERANDELFATYILRAIKSSVPLPENPQGLAQLASAIQAVSQPQAKQVMPYPPKAEEISGRKYVLAGNSLNLEALTLDFSQREALIELQIGATAQIFAIGLDNVYRINPVSYPLHGFLALRGFWQGDGFNLTGIYDGGVMFYLRFSFGTDQVVIDNYGLTGEHEVIHGTTAGGAD